MRKFLKFIIIYLYILRYNNIILFINFLYNNIVNNNRIYKLHIDKYLIYIRSNTPDIEVVYDALINGEYRELKKYNYKLESDIIIDAGGYIGTAAIELNSIYPEKIIYTIEPDKDNYDVLLNNVKDIPNIIPINKALFTKNGNFNLFKREREWGNTLIEDAKGTKNKDTINTVECITINKLMDDYGISKIGILKLDIEGSEKELFEEHDKWISNVEIIVVELHDNFVAGCSTTYYNAVKNMITRKLKGEKYLTKVSSN